MAMGFPALSLNPLSVLIVAIILSAHSSPKRVFKIGLKLSSSVYFSKNYRYSINPQLFLILLYDRIADPMLGPKANGLFKLFNALYDESIIFARGLVQSEPRYL